jgi:predicted phage-related endonuclease
MGQKGLGKTGETYLENWVKEQIYSRRKEFTSKYTQKGNETEDYSIDIIADKMGFGMLVKNEQYFENEFLCGTPDIVLKDTIIDAKSSWDCFTFTLFETELNKNYYWQVQGYMALTGIKKAFVCYVLNDTPMHLIQKEAFWYCKQNGYEDLDLEVFNQFIEKMTYQNIPIEYKFKSFEVEYNQADIDLIYDRVEIARNYIKTLI